LPRSPILQTPESFQLSSETVRFQATDGVALEGWLIGGHPSAPWIIGCHGLGSNRADLLGIAAALHEAGFNLFFFDFRGHGGSAGRTTSFGWLEQHDLQGALAFLGRRPDIPPTPYGIYGISMGGAVALMVAGRDERIGAMAVDSPYPNLHDAIQRHLQLAYPWIPNILLSWCVGTAYRLRFGVWPKTVSPAAAARHLKPRPFFLIQGAQDVRVPPDWGRRLVDEASGPKELWMVEGADHLAGFSLNPSAYRSRLVRFFQSSLS